MKPKSRKLTRDQIAELHRLRKQGKSLRELARKFGRSPSSISDALAKPPPRAPRRRVERSTPAKPRKPVDTLDGALQDIAAELEALRQDARRARAQDDIDGLARVTRARSVLLLAQTRIIRAIPPDPREAEAQQIEHDAAALTRKIERMVLDREERLACAPKCSACGQPIERRA